MSNTLYFDNFSTSEIDQIRPTMENGLQDWADNFDSSVGVKKVDIIEFKFQPNQLHEWDVLNFKYKGMARTFVYLINERIEKLLLTGNEKYYLQPTMIVSAVNISRIDNNMYKLEIHYSMFDC